MKNQVTFEETVELFINRTVNELIKEEEIPGINIIFKEEAYDLFYKIMKKPFKKKDFLTPNIKEKDIDNLRKMYNKNYPIVYVNNHILFFNYLMEITNSLVNLYYKYGEYKNARALLIQVMRRIWLRLCINDFNNIEQFLFNQLQFIKNDLLDDYKLEKNEFNGYKVEVKSNISRTWDETPKRMDFRIFNEKDVHTLPHIFLWNY